MDPHEALGGPDPDPRDAEAALADTDPRARGGAFAALVANPGDISRSLEGCLRSGIPSARACAIMVAANRGDAALLPVIGGLAGDPDDWVRESVAAAAGRLGGPSVVAGLLRDKSPRVRKAAARAALELGMGAGAGRIEGHDEELDGLLRELGR
ncbi:MAG: HEAT repeat domain-containing protein [Nitrosopumilus sp.]|nr:HEAT repeat domain-containing protein [Nitrosopumilus sp.]CAI9832012.1 hypothetical protein IBTHAUMO2_530012 [Nitrosopumilaceae archaeon]MDA7942283.1 HEAT repeat domain-containing protein [Nitrosopumilus sp.]MDA7943491.1 HEAT repeat domain-containing protein [Nitrosopumilus sp.]MDA7944920.1 HEAT repeat domain-containing protein [Nitrosopumilus sp.]